MLPQTARALHRIGTLTLVTLALGAGCKDPGPGKLFEEGGVWSLQRYKFGSEHTPTDINPMRGDSFLLEFVDDRDVVTAAWCGAFETETPDDSTRCDLDEAQWFCRCFGYAYEEDQMIWREYEPGTAPPEVPFDPANASGGGGGGGDSGTGTGGGMDDGGMAGDDSLVTVGEVPNVTSTYSWSGLPAGVFGSQGTGSQYIFQQKSPTVFAAVDCDPACL